MEKKKTFNIPAFCYWGFFVSFRMFCAALAAGLTAVASASVCAASLEVASVRPVTGYSSDAQVTETKRPRSALRRRAPSVAMRSGLRDTPDPLELSSSVAYMADQDSGEVFFEKNADIVLPIASVTKLMTALVIMESELPLSAKLTVTKADYVRSKAESQLKSGMVLTRESTLRAALMSSDNRAAHMLARTYPGGVKAFVAAMNAKAAELGMESSHFSDPTGLSNDNVSTARDLGLLAAAAHQHDMIRRASTTPVAYIDAGARRLMMQTTNRLIGDPRWKVGLQKTGFTTAAGRCMVVQSEFAGHRLVMVVLDSETNGKRADDMLRMRRWLEEETEFHTVFAQSKPWELM